MPIRTSMSLSDLSKSPNDIGIMTPYLGQVNLLRNLLKDSKAAIYSVDAFHGEQRHSDVTRLEQLQQLRRIPFRFPPNECFVFVFHLFLVGSGPML
uniref:AAA_12 domain-containing protein n=1 Tax=Panagrellus redivivus TaxID=6233 RepID=A0A7E4V1S2_PANRE